jgi:hypothetical protein
LGQSGELKKQLAPTTTKKDEGAKKSGNVTPAPAISTKVSGGGGFKSTTTKQPTISNPPTNATKDPQPIDKYEKDLNKSDLNTINN